MNYYEHHIGDYAEATAHLSFVEDAAYSRLIRKYYAQEKPLPVDLKAVQRLVGARTKEEKEAVQSVLDEFFLLEDDGWHNKRCDEEIGRYQEKQRKAKASAEARWSKPRAQSEGKANAMRTHTENDANASSGNDANAMRTHCEGNAHQSPITRHQTPDIKPETSLDASTVGGVGSGEDERPQGKRNVEIAVLLRGKGVKPFSFAHPLAMDWGDNPKVTDEILTAAIEQARDYKPSGDISPNYLKPIVEQLLNPPPAVDKPQKQPQDAWWLTNAGIDRKGKELGMFARGTETYNDFKDRIFAEIRKREGGKAA